MTPPPRCSPDVLAKRLYVELQCALSPRDMRALDCQSFLLDHPETTCAVTMAYAGLLNTLDEHGRWRNCPDVPIACLSFLEKETGITAKADECASLSALLKAVPVNADEIRRWFAQVYRCPSLLER
jgi:hypothetical protein